MMRDVGGKVWLVQAAASDQNEESRTFFNPIGGGIADLGEIPEMRGKVLLGCFEDAWFLLADEESNECFLLNLNDSQSKIDLPPLSEPFESLGKCNLSSSPTSPDCTIIFASFREHFLLFCRPHDVCCKEWTKLPIGDYYHIYGGIGSVVFEGKLYISSIQYIMSVVVFDVASLFTDNVKITNMYTPKRRVASQNISRCYLVVSCGELFMVCAIEAQVDWDTFTTVLTSVEVHRLDFSEDEEGDWERVESIGDRAFFIGPNDVALLRPDGFGVERDSIYYVSSCYDGRRLYKISLIDQIITFRLIPPELSEYSLMYWVVPTRSQSIDHESPASSSSLVDLHADTREKDQSNLNNIIDTSKSWADLPTELVESFSKHLFLSDAVRLPAVCKPWRSISNPIRDAKVWLMYCPKNDGTCNFFDPFNGQTYTLKLKSLECDDDTTRLLFSKGGWVVLSYGSYALQLVNPFVKEWILLPRVDFMESQIAFSCTPTSPDCIVLAISGPYNNIGGDNVVLHMWRPPRNDADDEWCEMKYPNGSSFYVAYCNPVFFRGEFYILGKRGDLGVFNPDNRTWRLLDDLTPIYLQESEFHTVHYNLVESGGELMAVFTGISAHYVNVFKLDLVKMVWVKLEDLEDVAIFLARSSSLARTFAHGSSGNNKIHFPRLHEGCKNGKGEFFCMKKQMYTAGFDNVKVPFNSVWLEPKLGHV